MGRVVGALLGAFASLAFVTTALAAPAVPSVLVSGQSKIAIIDGNGNGPDASDCSFTAVLSDFGFLAITPTQDLNVPLQACAGGYSGNAFKGFDTSSNFGDVQLNSTTNPFATSLPLRVELVDETRTPSASAPLGFDGLDDSITLYGYGESDAVQGSGVLLCGAGGPAARVEIPGLPQMLVALSFYPTSGTPQYLCIPGLPLVTVTGVHSLFNAYFPVTSALHITVGRNTTPPEAPFVDVNLNGLPGCGARTSAPAVAEWGLMLLALGLVATGIWRLGLRPEYQSLAML